MTMNYQMMANQLMRSTPSPLDDQLAPMGRRGDMMLAHITPREAMALKMMGGSGSINPRTGLMEFWDGDDGGGWGGESVGSDPGGMGDNIGGWGDATGGNSGGDYGYGIDAQQNVGYAYGIDPTETYSSSVNPILGDMAAAAEHNSSIGRGEEGTGYGSDSEKPGVIDDLINRGWQLKHNLSVDPLGVLGGAVKGVGKSLVGMAAGNFLSTPAGLLGFGINPALGLPFALAAMYYGNKYGKEFAGEAALPSQEQLDMYSNMNQNIPGGEGFQDGSMQAPNIEAQSAQSVTQPEAAPSFDRDEFGTLGQSMIQSQTRNLQSGAKSGSAKRGLGADSGQMANQLAVMRQQQQQKMAQWQQMMGNPNLGYNDLAQSLMNIMA